MKRNGEISSSILPFWGNQHRLIYLYFSIYISISLLWGWGWQCIIEFFRYNGCGTSITYSTPTTTLLQPSTWPQFQFPFSQGGNPSSIHTVHKPWNLNGINHTIWKTRVLNGNGRYARVMKFFWGCRRCHHWHPKFTIWPYIPSPLLFNTNTLDGPQFFTQKCSECFYAFLAKIKQLSRVG